jgi:hypothetical protein
MPCPACGSWTTVIRLFDRGGMGECSACRATWNQRGSEARSVKVGSQRPLTAIETRRWAP